MKLIDVIKSTSDNKTFIWKFPEEDFNTGSHLIVDESQEAILFLNGQALDTFGPGKYSLKTQNIPLLNKIINIPTDGVSPFHCKVYYVNKTEQMNIPWGTDSKFIYSDPNYNNYPFELGASGKFSLRVGNSRKLLLKLVGTESYLGQEKLSDYFKPPMMMQVKSFLPHILQDMKIPIFYIDQYMKDFSENLQAQLLSYFDDYGIDLTNFWITQFVKPESDPTYAGIRNIQGGEITMVGQANLDQKVGLINEQTEAQRLSIRAAAEAQAQAQRIVVEASARAQGRQFEGITIQEEKAFEVAGKWAENEGIGNYSNAGVGLGMMGGIASGIGSTMAGITAAALDPIANPGVPPVTAAIFTTPDFTNPVPGADPVPDADPGPQMINLKEDVYPDDTGVNTNSPQPASPEQAAPEEVSPLSAFKQKVEKLRMMQEAGLLSDEEFASEKARLLEQL